jgi:hypothetical protein
MTPQRRTTQSSETQARLAHQEKPKLTIVHNSAGRTCCAQLLVNSSQFFLMENGDVNCAQLFINSRQFFSIEK